MIARIKLLLATALAFVMPASLAVAPVAAQPQDVRTGFCQGVELDFTGVPGATDPNCDAATVGESNVNNIVRQVINIFTWIVGVVSVIMIIVGGFRYITSGGDPGNVGTAKNTILYAIIGLIIVVLAQIIVRFVVSNTNDAIT